jgi:Domain of unknown function (DUF4136)
MTAHTAVALALCVAAALSAGCASVMRVDSEVTSFAQWTSTADPITSVSYRFERLPSQAQGPEAAAHSALEGMVERVLARSGWQPVAAAGTPAPWQVQVSARTDKLPRAPWESAADGHWMRGGLWAGMGSGRAGVGGVWLSMESPYFKRSLSVVIRDTRTAQVVYETTAAHDGRWHDSPTLWQAMADAALQGFPQAPASPRQVNIDIPR